MTPTQAFCRADKAAMDRESALLSRATTLQECLELLRSDPELAALNKESGRLWKRLPKNVRAVVRNPSRKEFSMRNLKGSVAALAALVMMLVGAFGVAAAFRAYMVSLQ